MEFWLSYNNGEEKLQLPVPPSSFEMSTGLKNTTVNVIDFGEVNIIGKRILKTISISTFFPNQQYSFCQYSGFPAPYDCVNQIEKWQETGKPIRLLITETDINHAMAIESFVYGERDGSRDVYFTLSLKEYRFLKVKSVGISLLKPSSAIPSLEERPVSKDIASEYIVRPGDTLWLIAKRTVGDGGKWKDIASKNSIDDPKRIYVGQRLSI